MNPSSQEQSSLSVPNPNPSNFQPAHNHQPNSIRQPTSQQSQPAKEEVVKQQYEEEVQVALPRLKHKNEFDEDSRQLLPLNEEEVDRKPKPIEDPEYNPGSQPLHRLSKLKNKKISKKVEDSPSSSEEEIQKRRRGRAKTTERKGPRRQEASTRGKAKGRGKPKPLVAEVKKEHEEPSMPPEQQQNRRQPSLSESTLSTQPPSLTWKSHLENEEWDSLQAEVEDESEQRRTGCQAYLRLVELINSKAGGSMVELVGQCPAPFY